MDASTVETGLKKFIRERTGHDPAISNLARLSGGAGRETWTFDADYGSEHIDGIFRCDPVAGVESWSSSCSKPRWKPAQSSPNRSGTATTRSR